MDIYINPLTKQITSNINRLNTTEEDKLNFWIYYFKIKCALFDLILGKNELLLLGHMMIRNDTVSIFKRPYSTIIQNKYGMSRADMRQSRASLQRKGYVIAGDGKRGDYMLSTRLMGFRDKINKLIDSGESINFLLNFKINEKEN